MLRGTKETQINVLNYVHAEARCECGGLRIDLEILTRLSKKFQFHDRPIWLMAEDLESYCANLGGMAESLRFAACSGSFQMSLERVFGVALFRNSPLAIGDQLPPPRQRTVRDALSRPVPADTDYPIVDCAKKITEATFRQVYPKSPRRAEITLRAHVGVHDEAVHLDTEPSLDKVPFATTDVCASSHVLTIWQSGLCHCGRGQATTSQTGQVTPLKADYFRYLANLYGLDQCFQLFVLWNP